MKRRLYRLCCLIFLSSMLWGCTSASFFYNRLDFLLPWYVNGYTDLNSDQEAFLDARLDPFLGWHRSSELPCYRLLLDQTEAMVKKPVTAGDIADLSVKFELAWYRTQDEALDWMLDLGTQLTAEQIDEFIENLEERQEELEEELLDRSDEEFREETLERIRDTAEDYLGRLDKPQRAMLQAASEKILRVDAQFLMERARFIAELESLLAREEGWQKDIRELIKAQAENPDAEYQRALDHNVALMQQVTADVVNSRTEKQDKRLHKELDKLRNELDELVAQAENAGACSAEFLATGLVQ